MSTTINDIDCSSTDDQSKQCRICLDNDHPEDIVSPCLCSGSSAYVHRTCLNNWRSENANGRGFKYCNVCQFEYVIEPVTYDREGDRKRLIKYYLLMTRDLTVMVLLIQLVIIGLAYVLKYCDRNSGNIKNLFPNIINNGFTVYYLSALIVLLVLIGFIVIIIFSIVASNGTNRGGGVNFADCFKNGSCGACLIIAIIIICALIGIIFGVFISVIIIKKIMTHHTNKIWLRQEADKYMVKDFQGRRHELEAYRNNQSTSVLVN